MDERMIDMRGKNWYGTTEETDAHQCFLGSDKPKSVLLSRILQYSVGSLQKLLECCCIQAK